MKKLFAVIDVETSGGSPTRDKIIEIAIILFDGKEITKTFQSLVNPERSIPYYISGITGITNDMVADAPKFYEIAAEIFTLTEGRVFVGHNVHFDYNFVREEFKNLGGVYTRSTMDTVKLSRLAFPGLKSYSLGNLIIHFNLVAEGRHRAYADALATTEIFKMILDSGTYTGTTNDFIKMGIKSGNLPTNITIDEILALPEKSGVYYFYNDQDTLIYIGKSKNIKSRIAQHFMDYSPKSLKIRNSTHRFDFELTGNELVSLIKESEEIKKFKPIYNKAQRNTSFLYYLVEDKLNDKTFLQIISSKNFNSGRILKYFKNKRIADQYFAFIQTNIELHCFENNINIEEMNDNIELNNEILYNITREIIPLFEEDFALITQGRNDDE